MNPKKLIHRIDSKRFNWLMLCWLKAIPESYLSDSCQNKVGKVKKRWKDPNCHSAVKELVRSFWMPILQD